MPLPGIGLAVSNNPLRSLSENTMKTRHHTHSVWLRELLRRPLEPAAPMGLTKTPMTVLLIQLARLSHAWSSRSGGRADLSALRHARGHPLAGRTVRADGLGGTLENLCIIRAVENSLRPQLLPPLSTRSSLTVLLSRYTGCR